LGTDPTTNVQKESKKNAFGFIKKKADEPAPTKSKPTNDMGLLDMDFDLTSNVNSEPQITNTQPQTTTNPNLNNNDLLLDMGMGGGSTDL